MTQAAANPVPDIGAEWVRVDEAAALLSLTPRAARAAIRRGQLPARRYGREYRVPLTAMAPPLVAPLTTRKDADHV